MKKIHILAGATVLALGLSPAMAQEMDPNMPGMDHGNMDHGQPDQAPEDHAEHAGHDMHGMAMGDPFEPGAGSGTSRLPGNDGAHHGIHIMPGDDWTLMLHGYASFNYTDDKGPRGDDKAYVLSHAMLTASHDLGDKARLQLRTGISLEPIMRQDGYPSLFTTGEVAYGQALVDRQHPHDLFLELAARVDYDISDSTSVFLYGGPVGEPALGPSAFVHRNSAKYNPEPPITHHWFDSTHITYGVVTGGIATSKWQLEASAYRGREPDQRRWNIETPKLDSWSVRATWNPSPYWAVQVSHGYLKTPEELEPDTNEHRSTASAHYANGKGLSAMLGYSIKDKSPGRKLSAWLAEANWDINDHDTLFGRFENVRNDELFPDPLDPLHDQPFRVSKFQIGYAYRLPLAGPINLALGGTAAIYAKPGALDAAYGKTPTGFTLFAKFSLGH